jgi:uncharacterized membrane protein
VITLYAVLKFVHVILAIIAVGTNATYGIWLARVASAPPETHGYVLRGIKRLDDWFANPAYVLLAVTGLLTALVGGLPLATYWIAGGIVLWALAIVLGFFVYTPLLRTQIRALETRGADSTEYREAASSARLMGILIGIIVVVIVFLMVTKPTIG